MYQAPMIQKRRKHCEEMQREKFDTNRTKKASTTHLDETRICGDEQMSQTEQR